jgi:hypothetical protein
VTLNEFKNSANGSKLAPLLADSSLIARMEAMTRLGGPAVKAIDAEVALAVGTLDNVEKQHVGRWVRDILGSRGFRVACQRDWRGGKVFASGSVYEPIALAARVPSSASQPQSAIESARAALAAGRLDTTRPLDTVDKFIADRQANWGEA